MRIVVQRSGSEGGRVLLSPECTSLDEVEGHISALQEEGHISALQDELDQLRERARQVSRPTRS